MIDADTLAKAVSYDDLFTSPGIHVIDRTEKKFEKWLKRHSRALGKEYVPLNTREEKRQGWVKAIEWFESNQGEEMSES